MGITREEVQGEIDLIASKGKRLRFKELINSCTKVFGAPRINGSHHIFKMPWQGDPRINIQKTKGGKVKPYQRGQVLDALYRYGSMLN